MCGWSKYPLEREKALQMHEEGKSVREISKLLGVPRYLVTHWVTGRVWEKHQYLYPDEEVIKMIRKPELALEECYKRRYASRERTPKEKERFEAYWEKKLLRLKALKYAGLLRTEEEKISQDRPPH